MAMFPYDPAIIEAVRAEPNSITDVLGTLAKIDAICADGDGLKCFNWLYLQVTQAVVNRICRGRIQRSWVAGGA